MKPTPFFSALVLFCAALLPAAVHAGPTDALDDVPRLNAAVRKLLGPTHSFSAQIQAQGHDDQGRTGGTSGRLYLHNGCTSFLFQLSNVHDSDIPPAILAQMQGLGINDVALINRPDRRMMYLVFPGLQSCVRVPYKPEATLSASPTDFKLSIVKEREEIVGGHRCQRNKVVLTDKQGEAHAATLWNAEDLRNFPVRIHYAEGGNVIDMDFFDISLAAPDSSLFEVPAGYSIYDSLPMMLQQEFIKRVAGAASGLNQ